MSKKDGQLWKYPLPDDWTPTGYWCFSCVVPADQQYVDIVTGALGALTESKPFQPDATGQGPAAVALAFEKALYLMPFTLSETCSPTTTPPIPDEAAAADAAAAIFTVFFAYIVGQLNSCATTEAACGGCIDSLMTDLSPYGGGDAVRGALARLCTDLNNNPAYRNDYETECVYVDQFNDLKDKINNNPYDWLNQLSDWLFNWLNQTSSTILQDLNTVAGLLGGGGVQSFINDHGGIPSGGGAGFGGDCGWIETLDLTASDCGFAPDPNELTYYTALPGEYLAGVGWQGTDCVRVGYPTNHHNFMHLYMEMTSDYSITAVTVLYDLSKGVYHPASGYQYQSVTFEGHSFNGPWDNVDPDGSGKSLTLSGSYTGNRIDIYLGASYSDLDAPGGGLVRATTVIIHGTGANPFA